MSSQRPRRASLLALLALALLAATGGCAHRGSRLEGRWRGVRAEGVGPEVQSAANAFASGVELYVKGDTMTVTTLKDRQSGRYRIVKDEGSSVAITTDKDGPSDPHTFTFVDAETMKWAVIEGKTIVFARQ